MMGPLLKGSAMHFESFLVLRACPTKGSQHFTDLSFFKLTRGLWQYLRIQLMWPHTMLLRSWNFFIRNKYGTLLAFVKMSSGSPAECGLLPTVSALPRYTSSISQCFHFSGISVAWPDWEALSILFLWPWVPLPLHPCCPHLAEVAVPHKAFPGWASQFAAPSHSSHIDWVSPTGQPFKKLSNF